MDEETNAQRSSVSYPQSKDSESQTQVFWLQTHVSCSTTSTSCHPGLSSLSVEMDTSAFSLSLLTAWIKAPHSGWVLRIPHRNKETRLPLGLEEFPLETGTVQGLVILECQGRAPRCLVFLLIDPSRQAPQCRRGPAPVPRVAERLRVDPRRWFKSHLYYSSTMYVLGVLHLPHLHIGGNNSKHLWGPHED